MSDERENTAIPSTPLRVTTGVVILASVVAAVLAAIFVSAPLRMNGMLALVLLASLLISVAGGLWMLSATKNPWWALTFLPVVGVVVVWFLITLMVPVTLH
jgi:hypothetical protein